MSEFKEGGWYVNRQEENWTGADGPHPTRGAALAAAPAYAREWGEGVVHVGRAVAYRPGIDGLGEMVIEQMTSDALDAAAGLDLADNWLAGVPKSEMALLDALLREAVSRWLTETGNWPGWFLVEGMEEVDAAGEGEGEGDA